MRSADIRRRQYRWATLLQIAGIVATVVVVGLPGNLGTALILVQTLATQLLIVVAILQWRAFDVDVVIRRSVLAGTLLVVALGVYGVVVAIVSSAVGRDGRVPSLVGAAAVVLTVVPAALIARRVVDRAFYGRRGDPYTVVAELGRRASAASAPGEALDEIVEAITHELKLPYAAILDSEAVMLASSGTLASNEDCADLPLEHQGVAVGALRVGYRRGEDGLSAAEERLLSTLAHQVGASVRALQLVDGLKAAREQLVVAREDERRRIQRDLHDSLGPQLTAVTMHLDAARNHLAAGNPSDTDDLLRDARRELHQAGGDVRRLVYSLGDPSIASRGSRARSTRKFASSPRQPGSTPTSISSRSHPCRPPPRRRSTGSSPKPSPTWSDTPRRPDAPWHCGPTTDMSWAASPTTASAYRPTHSRASAHARSEIEPRNWAAR